MSNKKKQIVRSVLLVFFVSLVGSFQFYKTGLSEESVKPVIYDITYGKGGDVDLKLDLAQPSIGEGAFPALIFMHGSGWGYYRGISKSQYTYAIMQAAERGYVAVTVDYRLTSVKENGKTKYFFPAQVFDVKCAVRWLRANAKKYNIDPNRIGAIGWSSGGHLALMLGLTDPSDGLEGGCGDLKYSSRVQTVVSLAGPTDFMSLYKAGDIILKDFLGGTPDEVPENYRAASPLTYVSFENLTLSSLKKMQVTITFGMTMPYGIFLAVISRQASDHIK